MLFTYILVGLAAVSVYYLKHLPRSNIPSHLLHHSALWIDQFISNENFIELNNIIREMRFFPSNIDADLKTGGFTARYEHIGEAQDIGPDGKCGHMYLVPNVNRTQCILPQRIDIGRHFILTGGPDAIREPTDKMISRVSSFGRYMFHDVVHKYPTVEKLFSEASFQSAAKSICPSNQQYLDPFQFNFIMQVGALKIQHILS
jgi:hypothetical protein